MTFGAIQHDLLLTSLLLTTSLFVVGCGAPDSKVMNFNELPRIREFANGNATNQCLAVEMKSARYVRICVLGQLQPRQELIDLLPFLEHEAGERGANALHGRIPNELLEAAKFTDPFEECDPYWLTDVTSRRDGKLIAVRAAVSQASDYFYLEYGWSW